MFEPGVTVVVGPNGSGKSNVVDAISWVLGEQGPRALRGARMEDVIFAGSRLRPALGGAEVTLTIDDTAGALSVGLSEITVSRTLSRSGESEYRLNGAPCRLLDIREVLSDSGIGRTQHTIIGQGQLDEILTADPATIRAFIEEAAGVAKHRRRKERGLRKIAATEQNLVRLGDLLSEVRRLLRPLREQAEIARRHVELSEELVRVRLILAVRELAEIRRELGPDKMAGFQSSIRAAERELAVVEERLAGAERSRKELFQRSEAEREAAWTLVRAGERLGALGRLASERQRSLEAQLAGMADATARAKLDELGRELGELEELLPRACAEEQVALKESQARRKTLDVRQEATREREREMSRLRADQRMAVEAGARVGAEIGVLETSARAAEADLRRLEDRKDVLGAARTAAMGELEASQRRLAELEEALAPEAESAVRLEGQVSDWEAQRQEAVAELLEAGGEEARWRARSQARAGASAETAARLASLGLVGVVGVLSELVETPPEIVPALHALVGHATGVLVVVDGSAADRVLEATAPGEPLGLLIASRGRPPGAAIVTEARPLTDLVRPLHPAVASALLDVYLAGSAAEAAALAAKHTGAVFVTRDGTTATGPLLARTSAAALARLAEVSQRVTFARDRLGALDDRIGEARRRQAEAKRRLQVAEASIAAEKSRMAGAEREIQGLEREGEGVGEAQANAARSLASVTQRLSLLEATLQDIESRIDQASRQVKFRDNEHAAVSRTVASAGAAYDEARLEATRASERRRILESRRTALTAARGRVEHEAGAMHGRRRDLAARIGVAGEVARRAAVLAEAAEAWAQAAEADYAASRRELEEKETLGATFRRQRAALAETLDGLAARARDEDLARSELRIRGRILEERVAEWDRDPEELTARFGHRWEVEDGSRLDDPLERNAALEDGALRRKQARLEQDLAAIGQINPLADQEHEALAEREQFLSSQIADLRSSRRDILKVIASVDERIRDLFASALQDVSREYEHVFAQLFPGGTGRLGLTDPSDLLESGVEVEARPQGKNLRRLSLLSGGERALAALSLLFAIFRARPSPFYVLDEVEAALDDLNLHRFLGLIKDFRQTAQFLIVTHQKRTMEAADVLYGVSIRSDGASRVISERLSPAVEAAPRDELFLASPLPATGLPPAGHAAEDR